MTAITKVNIVKLADGNFLKAVHHIGETEYPDIEVQERLVDAMAAKMADPEFTKGCEVFVLPNLYGDRTAKLEKLWISAATLKRSSSLPPTRTVRPAKSSPLICWIPSRRCKNNRTRKERES